LEKAKALGPLATHPGPNQRRQGPTYTNNQREVEQPANEPSSQMAASEPGESEEYLSQPGDSPSGGRQQSS